jgi:ectoine hydroxylase-related dioxygenase (phytanoyl-CoA dioxygenase family)
VSDSFKAAFERDGYVVARRLFSAGDAARYRDHFIALRRRGSYPHDLVGADPQARDPLRRYPRMAHMHRWDEVSLRWLLDPRIAARLRRLTGAEPYAVQTMLYFKPPGARGQALHQDNYFLRAQPGTCVAAWMALDPADEDNGCLQVVPGSHEWPILCASQADTSASFTSVTVPLPGSALIRPVVMRPGDVLFFNGSLVHGSLPNRASGRFRRSLIGHYISADVAQVAAYYQPALAMDGTPLTLGTSPDGGPCGVWAEQDGIPAIELTGHQLAGQARE